MKKRSADAILKARLSEKKPFIQVLVGPRQVGKTTLVKSVLGNRGLYETADSPVPLNHEMLETWWKQALQTSEKILAIDEVQKIRGWSEGLKKLWDAKPHSLKIVLTGSSALLVEKGLKETLAGRFELIQIEHWNYQEAREIFGLSFSDYIEFGCYPGSIPLLQQDVHRWASYIRDSIVEPALGRDLLQLHPIDHPALLRQIFGVATQLPCQIISLQKLQGQLQGKGTLPTLQHYLHLLGEAFLVSGIEKYSPHPIRSRKSSPKLILHDNALIRAFERPVLKKIDPSQWGRYFENAIGARFIESGWQTYYWKERDLEVDFVVLGPEGERWAVEVKSSVVSEKDLKGLKRFCSLYPDFQPTLISSVAQNFEGIVNKTADEILTLHRNFS